MCGFCYAILVIEELRLFACILFTCFVMCLFTMAAALTGGSPWDHKVWPSKNEGKCFDVSLGKSSPSLLKAVTLLSHSLCFSLRKLQITCLMLHFMVKLMPLMV